MYFLHFFLVRNLCPPPVAASKASSKTKTLPHAHSHPFQNSSDVGERKHTHSARKLATVFASSSNAARFQKWGGKTKTAKPPLFCRLQGFVVCHLFSISFASDSTLNLISSPSYRRAREEGGSENTTTRHMLLKKRVHSFR